jgi:hypothetical protein
MCRKRDELFAVTREDVVAAAEKHLGANLAKAQVAVLGSDQNCAEFKNNREWEFRESMMGNGEQ